MKFCMWLGNSNSLVEEMHRLRRDCDFTKVTQNLEQVRTLVSVYHCRNWMPFDAIGPWGNWEFPIHPVLDISRLFDQVEPALRGLRQAVRENRVNCEDLVPLTEEVRQSYPTSAFPTTRHSYHLSQLLHTSQMVLGHSSHKTHKTLSVGLAWLVIRAPLDWPATSASMSNGRIEFFMFLHISTWLQDLRHLCRFTAHPSMD